MDRSLQLSGQFQKAKAMQQDKIKYRKIPKISPSMYKPLQIKIISPLGACTWKIVHKYNVKQNKNGKFTSNYKASPRMQITVGHRTIVR